MTLVARPTIKFGLLSPTQEYPDGDIQSACLLRFCPIVFFTKVNELFCGDGSAGNVGSCRRGVAVAVDVAGGVGSNGHDSLLVGYVRERGTAWQGRPTDFLRQAKFHLAQSPWLRGRAVSAFCRFFSKKVGVVQGGLSVDSVASHPYRRRKVKATSILNRQGHRATVAFFAQCLSEKTYFLAAVAGSSGISSADRLPLK